MGSVSNIVRSVDKHQGARYPVFSAAGCGVLSRGGGVLVRHCKTVVRVS